MLFHVAATTCSEHVRLLASRLRRVFTAQTHGVDVLKWRPSRIRFNSSKWPSLNPSHASPSQGRESDDNSEHTLSTNTNKNVVRFGSPSTRWELLHHIRWLLSLTPAAPFSRLLSIHKRYRALQSVESYNLLLLLSIRHSLFGSTHSLLKSMTTNKIEPNIVTEKLVVRHLVLNGRWKKAWSQVMARYSSVADIPMAVLLELIAPGTRTNVMRRQTIGRSSSHRKSRSSTQSEQRLPGSSFEGNLPQHKIPLDALLLILHRFPTLELSELAKLPQRVISYVVRGLLRNGHETLALLLTENHLKSLPHDLTPQKIEFARNLVHVHLSSGEIKLATYKRRRRLVERLFALHPSLQPNAKTVFGLMRYLKRSKRCGIEAYLFYKDYCARFGALVDSLDVRRRIVAYALKQRKYGIGKEISQLPPVEDPPRPDPSEEPPNVLYPVRSWRQLYPRKGKEKRYWKRTFIRLLGRRRAWQRRKATIRWPKPSSQK